MTATTTRPPRSRTFTTPYGRKVSTKANKRFVLVFEFWRGFNPEPVDLVDTLGGAHVVMRSDNYRTVCDRMRRARRSVDVRYGRSFGFYIFDKFSGERLS